MKGVSVKITSLYLEPIKKDGRYNQFYDADGNRCHKAVPKIGKYVDMTADVLEWDKRASDSNVLLAFPHKTDEVASILEGLFPGKRIIPTPF